MASKVSAISSLPELVIEQPNLLHIQESYLRQVANGKPFTAKKKNKSAVAGSTAKIYRQKGTGRARQGERTNVHFRGGGMAFPPLPRTPHKKLNKLVRKSALRSAVLWHVVNGSAWQIEGSDFDGFDKTSKVAGVISEIGTGGTLCLVIPSNSDVERCCRNIGRVRLSTPETLNVRDLMDSEGLVFAASALNEYRELLQTQNVPVEDEQGDNPEPVAAGSETEAGE